MPLLILAFSCDKFIDVVPDNVPELDQAFNLRVMAQRFLATCYSRLPSSTSIGGNPGYLSADEFWLNSTANYTSGSYPNWYIAMGQQNSNSPLLNFWGSGGSGVYWQGLYDCNIMIERVHSVPDMDSWEKDMWAAEAMVLKAYYHFLLLRTYGPIILNDENNSVYADPGDMQRSRETVDQCFDYIVRTIDKALPALMIDEQTIGEGNQIIGRITQIIARTIKAQILVESASPLFNGNTDMASLTDEFGSPLFNQQYEEEKWERAAIACKEAVELAQQRGKQLHRWKEASNVSVSPSTNTPIQMSFRTAFNESDANSEGLWYDTKNIAGASFQAAFYPRGLNSNTVSNGSILSYMGVSLNIVEKFYSKNGIPIEEDKTYPYGNRFEVISVPNTDAYRFNLQPNYNTIRFHLDREPRFYAAVSFDGGRYFMQSQGSDTAVANNNTITNYKRSGNIMSYSPKNSQATGYMSKKHVNYQNSFGTSNSYNARSYAIPIIRLADLYLLYAEALNESQGPSQLVYDYVDSIRLRSGLDPVVASWSTYSSQPGKPTTKEGMRSIIKQERTIELAFEGKRFWDLRRWKDAVGELNTIILGWDISQRTPEAFYRQAPLYSRVFTTRDYFWPIAIEELRRNPKLKQNPGL